MRAIVGGDPSQRSALQRIANRPQGVRSDHEVFLNWAHDSIATSVAASSQILRDFGESAPSGRDPYDRPYRPNDPRDPYRGGDGSRPASPARSPGRSPRRAPSPGRFPNPSPQHMRSASPGRMRSASPRHGPPNIAYTAAANAPLTGGMVLSETVAQEAALGRARSARDLFAALSDGTGALAEYNVPESTAEADGGDTRVINVREFQRGTAVVKPARPLPFPGPEGLSPGERKRAQAVARAAGREKLLPRGAPAPQPTLADGVTTMLTGVRCELGEILTAPVSPFSSFDNLLDRLVDTPEACFVNPASLPWSPVVIAGRAAAPGGHRNQNIRGNFSFRT